MTSIPSLNVTLWQLVVVIETTPVFLRAFEQFEDHRERGPVRQAFIEITHACNECHQVAGVDFIAFQTLSSSPLSNQDFFPH